MIPITHIKSKEKGLNWDIYPYIKYGLYFNARVDVVFEVNSDYKLYLKDNEVLCSSSLFKKIGVMKDIKKFKIDYNEWAKYCDPKHEYMKDLA